MGHQANPSHSPIPSTFREALSLVAEQRVRDAANLLRAASAKSSPSPGSSSQGLTRKDRALIDLLCALVGTPESDARGFLLEAEIEHICGRHPAALAILSATRLPPELAGHAHVLASQCFNAMGDKVKSIENLRSAIRHLPKRADLHSALGTQLLSSAQTREALAALSRAIALNSKDWHAHFEMGNALRKIGQAQAAIDAFSRALHVNPSHADSFNNRGATLQSLDRHKNALADFNRAIELNGRHLFAWLNKAVSLGKLSLHEECIKALETALAINPGMGDIYHNLGIAQLKLERNAEALRSFETALLMQPDRSDWLVSKGNALSALRRYGDAVDAYRQCVARDPANTDARINMAGALQELRRHREAIAILDEVLAIRPDYPEAMWNKANSMLPYGPSREAWQTYEHRLHISIFEKLPDYGLPLLGSENIKGRKLLVQWEQRFGDVLQMLRYVPAVSAICEAHWQIAQPLADLVCASFPEISVCGRDECPPGLDARVPFTSLPLAMETFSLEAIPAALPYLRASDAARAKWSSERDASKLNVGVAWRGNRNPPGRTVPIGEMSSLFEIPGIRFVSLQIDPTAEEAAVLKRHGVADVGGGIASFDDSAALIESLDTVVTIDTAIAHLSGALGVKTLVVLKYGADWRWLLDRSDSPWYPSATLFRQVSSGRWEEPLSGVKAKLAAAAEEAAKSRRDPHPSAAVR